MIASLIASVVSLQLETGYVRQSGTGEDTYVEYQLPHWQQWNTAAFGASVREDLGRFAFEVGYRNLGRDRIDNASIVLPDATYFRCYLGQIKQGLGNPYGSCTPTQVWNSVGDIQQVFLQAGYRIPLGKWYVVPTLGVAEDRIAWHTLIREPCIHYQYTIGDHIQEHPQPLAGVALERGRVGLGFYVLGTQPTRVVGVAYPGQGNYAMYLRVTYKVPL